MATEHWQRISELFHAASQRYGAERIAFLDESCGEDTELRREVESLLAHHDDPATLLGDPAIAAMRSNWDAPGLSADRDSTVGRRLGRYRVDEKIASGGMGTVYRGSRQDGQLDQTVAIKVLHPWRHADDIARRFRTEWQTLADLVHPNIAKVLDAGTTDDGTPYLVMEYIDGGSIDDFCDRERLAIEGRLELFESVARAVHFAHQNLVVHRDLKPANILVTDTGQPKLLDFGIAKTLAPSTRGATVAETATHTLLMTPLYASPEQLSGKPVTTATDIYSLGVLLYELLTGRRPHEGATATSTHVERVLSERDPLRPSTSSVQPDSHSEDRSQPSTMESRAAARGTTPHRLRRQLRGDLDNIVMRAMQRDPSRRYASAEALADDVRRHLNRQPVAARPDTLAYRTWMLIARNRVAAIATAATILTAIVGTFTTAWQASVAATERDEAAAERDHARIEANSSLQIVEILSDAFLVSASRQSPEQVQRLSELLDRHAYRVRRQYADQHHERANLLDALGRVYAELELFAPAETLLTEAKAIREREFGLDSLETALSHGSHGQLAYQRGDLAGAIEHFSRALELQTQLPVGVHTDVARAMNDLAVVLRLRGDIDRAEALHERALELRRQDSGDNHLTVAESLNNLAAIRIQRGDHKGAFTQLERALDIRRTFLGEQHPLVAQSLNNLATVGYELGQQDKAINYMREALRLYRSIPGTDQAAIARALINLAGMTRAPDVTESARVAREALDFVRSIAKDGDHPQLGAALLAVAQAAHTAGDADTAERHYEQAIEFQRRALPSGHQALGSSLCNYGALLLRSDPIRAEEVLQEAIQLLRSLKPRPVAFLSAAERNLARSLARQERYSDAASLLRELMARFAGRNDVQWQKARDQLESTYVKWGKPELAAELPSKPGNAAKN